MIVALLLAGCVSPGDVTSSVAPNGAAGRPGTIVVYRPKGKLLSQGEPPYVTVAGKTYGTLPAGSYFAATVPEGDVKVTANQAVLLVLPTIPKSVEVAVIATGTSYVRVDQIISSADLSGGVTVNQQVVIEEVSPIVGQAEIRGLREIK